MSTAALLADDTAIDDYLAWIRKEATTRLEMLHTRLTTMGRRLPIKALSPEGAIYLSVEFALRGYRHNGQVLSTSGDVRTFLLDAAGIAVVPFDAFGAGHAQDWYRLSVGAVSVADLDAAMTRLETALVSLEAPADSASPSSAAV